MTAAGTADASTPSPRRRATDAAARLARASVGWARRHGEWIWAPLLYAAASALLYRQIWGGEIGFGWDTIEAWWADLAHLGHAFSRLEWPLWNPNDRGGYPFHADPEAGLYYPLHWLFAAGGAALGGTSWWLIQLKMLVHHAIAGGAMHAFLRSRGLPRIAAVVGGLGWLVGAPLMIHKASNIIMPLVWTPLIWVAIDRLAARPSWRAGCAVAGGLYLAGTASSAPGFFYVLLLVAPYGLFRAISSAVRARRGGWSEVAGYARQLSLWTGLAAAVAVAMLVVAVLPGLELTAASPRAERSVAYATGAGVPLGPALAGIAQPDIGSSQMYLGIAVTFLALCALALAPRRDGGAPIYLAAASGMYLLLNAGAHSPVLPWLVEHVPGFDMFRIANRYKLALAVVAPALAGYGVAAVVDRGWRRPARLLVTVGALALALVAALYWIRAGLPPEIGESSRVARSVQVLLVAAAAAFCAAASRRWVALPGAAVLTLVAAVDVPHFRSVHGPIMEARPRPDAAILDELEGIEDRWRVWDEFVIGQRAGSRFGFRELRSYTAGAPLDLERYRDVREMVSQRPAILGAFNVRYVLHGMHHRNGRRAHHLKSVRQPVREGWFRELGDRVFEVAQPAPLVAWYGRAVIEDEPPRVLERLADQHEAGERSYAIVEPPHIPEAARPRIEDLASASVAEPARDGQLLEYRAHRIRATIDAPGPGLVVLNEIQYPGWKVTVDGREATPLTANYLLRAVWVDAGAHELVWTYEPPRYGLWLALWLAGWVALLAAFAAHLRGRARRA